VLNLFLEVWDVGQVTANRWYDAGCRTIQDARQREDLTEHQRVSRGRGEGRYGSLGGPWGRLNGCVTERLPKDSIVAHLLLLLFAAAGGGDIL
jgi:hypothetical protein